MKLLQKTKFSAIKGANIKPQLQQQLMSLYVFPLIISKFRFINRPEIPLTAAK